jgi:RND family efflux transporter MFP subunit
MEKSIKLGLVLLAAGLAAGCSGSKAAKSVETANANVPKQTAVDVSTARAIQRNLPGFLEVTGNLAADAQADVAPLVSGKVVETRGDIGSWVEKGSVLARLDDRDARLRLQQAEAQVGQAKAQVAQARAQANAANAQVNQAKFQVRQAEVRVGMRPGQASLVSDDLADPRAVKAQLDLAEKELARFEKLLATGDVSQSARDQRRAQRDQLAQQYDSVRAASAQTYQAVFTARAAVVTAEQQAAAARQQIATAEQAVVAAETQAAQARKAIADTVIYAPMSGYILERPADTGEYVSIQGGGGRVATIVRANPLRARVDVPEQAISDVRVGQSVSVAVADWPDRNFAGTIARLSPNVTAASRTLTVEAEISNGDNLLRPGQFVTVRILQAKSAPSVLVPQRAVKTEGQTAYVYVIKDGYASRRQVQLGQQEGDLVQVKTGVQADETVATSNVEQLSDGIAVRQ